MDSQDWFEDWFDTKFYHMLYRHRDDTEAQDFIDHLLQRLQLPSNALIQDLACGTGRHSIYLNSLGYNTVGLDLSQNNIKIAKESENSNLHFEVHDMRELYIKNHFDAILNLFTSFGYFSDISDNIKVIKSVYAGLKPNGYFVIDYLNSDLVLQSLPSKEIKSIDGYQFEIYKSINNNRIEKEITIQREGRKMQYTESVYAFREKELCRMIEENGFKIHACYGNYRLDSYDSKKSQRMIVLAKKA